MGSPERLASGYAACSNEGCTRPARSQTKPGLCHPCQARASYHRKNPDAATKPLGHHGKWKGVGCIRDGCTAPVISLGLCQHHYNTSRWCAGHRGDSYTPEKRRAARIKSRYGITAETYDRMVAERGNRCDVCGEPPSSENTRAHWRGKLCIDHCHDTGVVRGLLCNDCNLAVGYGKTPDKLRSAAEYLQRFLGRNI